MLRTTHTYALLQVSEETYKEIHNSLLAAGYGHAIDLETGEIDMHGLALVPMGSLSVDE